MLVNGNIVIFYWNMKNMIELLVGAILVVYISSEIRFTQYTLQVLNFVFSHFNYSIFLSSQIAAPSLVEAHPNEIEEAPSAAETEPPPTDYPEYRMSMSFQRKTP